jgi:hypothetical protein
MLLALLILLLSTLVVASLLWRALVLRRRAWRMQQWQIQDHLATIDLEAWLATVAPALAEGRPCPAWETVQSPPYPTLRHMGGTAPFPWTGVLLLWLGLQGVGWIGVVSYHALYSSRIASLPSHRMAPAPGGPAGSGDVTNAGAWTASYDTFPHTTSFLHKGSVFASGKRWNATVPLLTTELAGLAGRAWSGVGPRYALVLPAGASPWCRLTAVLQWQEDRASMGMVNVYLLEPLNGMPGQAPLGFPYVQIPVEAGETPTRFTYHLPCPRGDFQARLYNDTGQALAATPASVITLQAMALDKVQPK